MSNLWRPWDAEEEESVRSENNQLQDKGKSFSWYCLQRLRQIDDYRNSLRAGSLVWVGYRGQRSQRRQRTENRRTWREE